MDVGSHPVGYRFDEAFDLFCRPFGHEFDTAVCEVADKACDVKVNRDVASAVTEANALNTTRKEAVTTRAFRGDHLRFIARRKSNPNGNP